MLRRFLSVCVVCTCAALCGCASYATVDSPQYASAWQEFAQSSAGLLKFKRVGEKPAEKRHEMHKEYDKKYREREENKEFVQRFEETLKRKEIDGESIDMLQEELAANTELNRRLGFQDPGYEAWLGERYRQLRERLNAKAMEILRIEPTISISDGTKVKVAIVEIGEEIQTIRYEERNRWREFFRKAGFAIEPVFLPVFLVGDAVSADAIRMAAARVGAGAVLAYTTTAETELGPLRESIAVLAFAKCMLIDTRTEYLYFNAEGEGKDWKVTFPCLIDTVGFERGVIETAIEGLRREVLHELERLRAQK